MYTIRTPHLANNNKPNYIETLNSLLKENKLLSNTRNNSRKTKPRKKEHLWFDELSMKEAEKAAKMRKTIIFPVGSVEEHGEHLPLSTDSIQPEYVALEVAKKTKCLVAPTLRYGVCNSTRGFPGTISITFEALAQDGTEMFLKNSSATVSEESWYLVAMQVNLTWRRSGSLLKKSSGRMKTISPEKRVRIMVCSDYDFAYELKGKHFSDKDGHAGTIETSRIMTIRPNLVKAKGKTSFPEMPRFEIVAHPEKYFPSWSHWRSDDGVKQKRTID